MKYDYTDGTSVESNITDEGTRMGISPDAIAHVINVLTDLYSDPAGAAVRESATNADDAQRANGVDEPIRIFLPTEFSSVYEVIDRGEGMSAYTLRHEFGQYGWSSKRDSNDFNGMLGLGCKAPLTYTPQFTVVSVKDGLKNTAIIERGEDGVGRVRIPEQLHDVPTDEPNGTTVQIPVIDIDSFNEKARNFFRFWDPGTVLINGEAPESVWEADDVIKLDDDVILVPQSAVGHSDRVHVVMAGVAYPLDSQHTSKVTDSLGWHTTVVARIPTGSVNIPGNREALQYTSKTEDLIATLADYVKEATGRRFRERVSAARTPGEAMDAAEEARKVMRNFRAEWQGKTVPTGLRTNNRSLGSGSIRTDYGMRWNSSDDLWNVTANDAAARAHNIPDTQKTLVVTGYTNSSVSAINKAKVQRWMQANDVERGDVGLVLFRSEVSRMLSIWLDGSERIVYAPWSEVKEVNLPDNVRRAAGYTRPSYSNAPSTAAPSDDLSEVRKVQSDGGYRVISRSDVRAKSRVLMLAPSDMNKGERDSLHSKVSPFGITIIVVNKSRHDEALDLFDNLIALDDLDNEIAASLRERYDALPILAASYAVDFNFRTGYNSAKRKAESLATQARHSEFFSNDHRIKSLQAITARMEEATDALRDIRQYLHSAEGYFGHEGLPVYIKALRDFVNRADHGAFTGREGRPDIDKTINRIFNRFHDAYPLFDSLSRNSSHLAEYARLLSQDPA